ncbi:MAG TPA: SDR family NAD(P)-dependent oxidoreductase [Solirubrobacteraceae bacterium]|jgi:NAD(P)-dependent dehydrogenase (short-subunit alcohol dehydrogenase family)|nr:SDR family NAD(P)-dependent oxidoreductase [Solirubrobacteraceae bacterium]
MKATPIDLERAVVAVTGGGRGIGRATAKAFAERGARVAIGDLYLQAASDAALEIGQNAIPFELDAGDRDSYATFAATVQEHLGPIDVLVNNAGIMPVGPLFDEPESVSVAQMNVNFWAHYHGLRLVAPGMVRRGRGHIVNVTSAAGKIHAAGLAMYCATKHAANALSRSAREELNGTGVTVTAVMPAAVKTQLTDGIPFNILPFGLERAFILKPESVADTIVGTLKNRPALAGTPRGLTLTLDVAQFVPEPVWLLARKLVGADRTLGPIDRDARREYDARIEAQLPD